MKKLLSFVLSAIIAFSVFSLNISADELKTPSGISADSIGSEIENMAKDKNYSSFQTVIFCGDDVLYTGRFGYSDVENKIPVDENSVYEWGSISKTLVWVSVMQLYEQGKLDLDADVRDYLPEGFFKKLKYDEPITMLDIMNHQGGWQESTYSIMVKDENKIPPLEDALHYCEPPQVFHPGEVTSYSNWGTALAGYIVECISGEDFCDYVHEHILEPLGMEHTALNPDHSDNMWVKRQREKMKSYTAVNSDDGQGMILPKGGCLAYFTIYPAGSATGTIDDIAKYGQALVSDNCPLFENQETAELMFSGSNFYGDSDIPSWCHGFFPMYGAADTVGHNGATFGFSSNFQIDRKSKFGCAVFASQKGESIFTTGIPELIFGNSGDSDVFSEISTADEFELNGTYLMARSHFKGFAKVLNIFSYTDIEKTADKGIIFRHTDDGIIVLELDGQYSLLGDSQSSDGRKILCSSGVDMIRSDTVKFSYAVCIAYIVIAVLGFIFVMTVWIMRIIKRRNIFRGAAVICAADIAKAVSCLCAAGIIMIFSENSGITHAQGITAGIIQISCIVLYAFSAAISVKCITLKDAKKSERALYAFDMTANIIAVSVSFAMGLCSF